MMQSQPGGGLPKMQQFVFSTTLKHVDAGTTLISEEIETSVNRIKNGPGKDIWLFGGAGRTTSLLNRGLFDELQLAVHPVILGGGSPSSATSTSVFIRPSSKQRTTQQDLSRSSMLSGVLSLQTDRFC